MSATTGRHSPRDIYAHGLAAFVDGLLAQARAPDDYAG